MALSLLCESGQQEEAVTESRKWPPARSHFLLHLYQVFHFMFAFNLYRLTHESEMHQNLKTTIGGFPDLEL